jgi:hypothetical protein
MTGLVNSLMENFYIPPIILNKKTSTAPAGRPKEAVHVCVDGKQRLSSVRAFVKGMIPCHDMRGEKWYVISFTRLSIINKIRWFCDTSGRRKKILSEAEQRMFLDKEFVSFEFVDLSPRQEEDLFARVQMGVQLSVAEKMRASTGPWQELARLYVDDFPIIYSLMKDRARAKDFQLTLSCFSQVVEVLHPSAADGVPALKTLHNVLPKLLSNEGAVDDRIKSRLASIWNTFKDLIEEDEAVFTNANKYLRGVQTFAPIEMVAVVVLILMYSETRNKYLLLGDIRAMREAIRENFVDIRMNVPCWKFIWEFIDNLEAIRGAVDGSTVNRRVQPPPTRTVAASVPRPLSASIATVETAEGAATKRTRPPQVLPTQRSVAVKKENISAPPSNRQQKRQRIDDGSAGLPAVHSQQPQFPPLPSRVSATPVAQTPPRAPNNHKASTASMVPTSLTAPTLPSPTAHVLSAASQSVASAYAFHPQRTLDSSAAPLNTRLGAIPPKRTHQKRTDIAQPITPPHEPPLINATSHHRPLAKPRNTSHRSTPAQHNNVVDLTSTSDTEEERQYLLSAFKSGKSPATDGHHTATPRLNQNGNNQLQPARNNNPYAKFRQERGIGP